MDGSRFDTWTRGMAQSGSRRAALRTLVAGWLAAGGVAVAGDPALGAPCKKPGKGCDKNGDCCRGLTCKGGKCACKGGAKTCGDACCGKGEKCLGAGKQQTCCPQAKVCNDECCGPHKVCVCPIPPDIPGEPPPDSNALCSCRCEDGWEENAKGECVCASTLCGLECCEESKGERCCGRNPKVCTNTKSSKKHCGECGHACPEHLDCVGGECRCPSGNRECNHECLDEQAECCHHSECPGASICCGFSHRCTSVTACCDVVGWEVCGFGSGTDCCDPSHEQCCDDWCFEISSDHHCGRCGNDCTKSWEYCCDLPPERGGPRCLSHRECRRLQG